MAKKSSKSTRRARAKKEIASKKTAPVATSEEAVILTEGSDEPVVKAPKKAPAKKAAPKKKEAPAEQAVAVEETETLESIEQMARPERFRMLVSAAVLVAVLIAAVTIAALLGRGDHVTSQSQASPQTASQTATDPDKLLETGGSVCTNGKTQTNPEQSVDPTTVGMMLQSVPSQQIQTPQGLGSSNDTSTLQGASCF